MKSLLLFAVVVACVYADCKQTTVTVNDDEGFTKALSEAVPGVVITLAAGQYYGPFELIKSGERGCPIVIKAEALGDTVHSSIDSEVMALTKVSNVEIHNLAFEKMSGKEYYGLKMEGCRNVLVKNSFFDGFDIFGISLKNSSSNTVDSCKFLDIGDDYVGGNAIWIGADGSDSNVITKCVFGDSMIGDTIQIGYHCHNTTISGCTFNGRNCMATAWIRNSGYYTLVTGNTFVNPNNYKLKAGISTKGADNIFQLNSFDLNRNIYAIDNQGDEQRVCASNKIISGAGIIEEGEVDQSC